MRRILSACLALLALPCGPAPAAPAPIVLKPETGWAVDYGEERCSLARKFSANGKELWLRIDSYGSWTMFGYQFTGNLLPVTREANGPVRLAFTPAETEPRTLDATLGTVGDYRAISFKTYYLPKRTVDELNEAYRAKRQDGDFMVESHPLAYDKAFESEVAALDLWPTPAGAPIRLELGKMAEPIQALRTCVDDLMRSWGLDPEVQHHLTRDVGRKIASMSRISYPTNGDFYGGNGDVHVRINIDATGKPTACAVQNQGAAETFRKMACEGMMSVEYRPALDAAGKPVASVTLQTILFRY